MMIDNCQPQTTIEVCNKDLFQKRKYTYLLKECAESTLFIFLANKNLLECFNKTPLHFVFFPVLGLTLTVDAIIESIAFHRNRNKDLIAVTNLVTVWITAGLVDVVVIATLVLGVFALGPYLFLGVIGAMMLRTLTNLSHYIKKYRTELDPDVKKSLLQTIAFNAVGVFGILLMAVFIVGVMISPFGSVAAMSLGVAMSLFTISLLFWKLVPDSSRHKIKASSQLFRKASYQKIESSDSGPSTLQYNGSVVQC